MCLTAQNSEADAETIARWSLDSEYWRLAHVMPARPRLAKEIREYLDRRPLEACWFAIRTVRDNQLIGDVGLFAIRWSQGEASTGIGIGERTYWGQGYGTEAMRLLLRYAFTELNLQRISLSVLAGNGRAIRSYEKAGFIYEGRQQQIWSYDGQRLDEIHMGVLRQDWQAVNTVQ